MAHGSQDPRPQVALEKLAGLFRHQLGAFAADGSLPVVNTGVLELGPTSLEEQLQVAAESSRSPGFNQLQLVPLFLLPGVHVMEDIPAAAAIAQKAVPDIPILLCSYLGEHRGIVDLLARRMAMPDPEARILLSHGSRRPGGNDPVERLAIPLKAHPAYWFVEPSLETQIQAAIAAGHQKISIFPYFLFAGTTTDAIAREVDRLGRRFTETELKLASPLEPDAELAQLLLDLVQIPAPFPEAVQ